MKATTLAILSGVGLFLALWLFAMALLPSSAVFPAGGASLVLAMLFAESVKDSLE